MTGRYTAVTAMLVSAKRQKEIANSQHGDAKPRMSFAGAEIGPQIFE